MNADLTTHDALTHEPIEADRYELTAGPGHHFDFGRRTFMKLLGAGVLVTAFAPRLHAQRRGGGGGPQPIAARLHIGVDGVVTVLTGKVEVGQGSRAQLTQAAAEELRLPPSRVVMVMADTARTPDDGGTSGSRTTPRTVPAVRRAAAAARELLAGHAAEQWQVGRDSLTLAGGTIRHAASGRSATYAELAASDALAGAFQRDFEGDVALTPVGEWKVLGESVARPNLADVVTGAHRYPSDIVRPGMLYGKILRAPTAGATLASVDLAPARAMEGVVVVRDGEFVGCAAPNSHRAAQAVAAISATAQWSAPEGQPSHETIYRHLKDRSDTPAAPADFERALSGAAHTVTAAYHIPYIAHTPMEPRAAVAEWEGDSLTVWTGSQNPNRIAGELARAFNIPEGRARVIIPDTGGAFGGKHTGETALEAARLAKAAGRPVHVFWTREEEFRWAYFRPVGLIEARAGLDAENKICAWEFFNYNSGRSALSTPYDVPARHEQSIRADQPFRQGSYRALASAANCFARESLMDDLAALAAADPLAFRLAHLSDPRLRNVLNAAAERFGWSGRASGEGIGHGIACGTEKDSVIATAATVRVDPASGAIAVQRLVAAFECGAVLNPHNLRAQVAGAIIQGLGPALTEAIEFRDGRILNPRLSQYRVPRFRDVPPLEVILLDRPDLPTVGAGETPLIALAPAIRNAVLAATGTGLNNLPLKLPST